MAQSATTRPPSSRTSRSTSPAGDVDVRHEHHRLIAMDGPSRSASRASDAAGSTPAVGSSSTSTGKPRSKRPGEGEALGLPAGDEPAAIAHAGVETTALRATIGQAHARQHHPQVGVGGGVAGEEEVLPDRFVEQVRRLLDQTDRAAQVVSRESARVDAADAERSLVVEEAHQHVRQRRLARSARAGDEHALAGADPQVDVFQRPASASESDRAGHRAPDTVELDPLAERGRPARRCGLVAGEAVGNALGHGIRDPLCGGRAPAARTRARGGQVRTPRTRPSAAARRRRAPTLRSFPSRPGGDQQRRERGDAGEPETAPEVSPWRLRGATSARRRAASAERTRARAASTAAYAVSTSRFVSSRARRRRRRCAAARSNSPREAPAAQPTATDYGERREQADQHRRARGPQKTKTP